MHFHVIVEEKRREVDLSFGQPHNVTSVTRWRAPRAVQENPAVRDSLEFAQLASKRWRYYRRSILTATSMASFRSAIKDDTHAEVSFILLARADWFPPRRR